MGFCGHLDVLSISSLSKRMVNFTRSREESGYIETSRVLETVTRNHYNVQKTRADSKTRTVYDWSSGRYSARKDSE
jgi:hypothetical protein